MAEFNKKAFGFPFPCSRRRTPPRPLNRIFSRYTIFIFRKPYLLELSEFFKDLHPVFPCQMETPSGFSRFHRYFGNAIAVLETPTAFSRFQSRFRVSIVILETPSSDFNAFAWCLIPARLHLRQHRRLVSCLPEHPDSFCPTPLSRGPSPKGLFGGGLRGGQCPCRHSLASW